MDGILGDALHHASELEDALRQLQKNAATREDGVALMDMLSEAIMIGWQLEDEVGVRNNKVHTSNFLKELRND